LELDAAGCGVGEDKASAESKGKAGGFEGVSARCHVVHEIALAERMICRERACDCQRTVSLSEQSAVITDDSVAVSEFSQVISRAPAIKVPVSP